MRHLDFVEALQKHKDKPFPFSGNEFYVIEISKPAAYSGCKEDKRRALWDIRGSKRNAFQA